MKTIYYKVVKIWHKSPFQNTLDEKKVEFYEEFKGKLVKIESLKIDSNTSIKEKEDYVEKQLGEKFKILKIN